MVINDIPEKDNTNIPMKKSKLQYVAKNKAVVLIAIAILAILVSFFLRFIDVRFFLDFPLERDMCTTLSIHNKQHLNLRKFL